MTDEHQKDLQILRFVSYAFIYSPRKGWVNCLSAEDQKKLIDAGPEWCSGLTRDLPKVDVKPYLPLERYLEEI